MDAEGGQHPRIALRLLNAKLCRFGGGRHVDDMGDGAVEKLTKKAVKLGLAELVKEALIPEVGVGIKQLHQWIRSPGLTAGSRNTTRTSSSPEARSIPRLYTPQRVAGARLATITTILPMRSSGL